MINEEYIRQVIKDNLRNKFRNYKPKDNVMPFHLNLLGKDRMALFSFIQSLNTTFGASLFEPVAVELAKSNLKFKNAEKQHVAGNKISESAQIEIQNIMNQLSMGGNPDKKNEIEKIRSICNSGRINDIGTVRVDLFLETVDGEIFLFDLKTAKPNKSNFKDFKRTLLEWSAIKLYENPQLKINTLIAIPYNPYEPEPYQFWTSKGMLEFEQELKVAEQFWDFLGGNGTYDKLLECFKQVGIEMHDEIDEYFKRFK